FLHAIGTENRRHADIEAVEAVLAVYIDSARQDALLVAQISLGHRNRAGGGGVVGGAGLEQADDLAAARAGALDDGVDGFLARLAHLDEVVDGDARNGGVDRKSTRLNSSHVKNSYAVF